MAAADSTVADMRRSLADLEKFAASAGAALELVKVSQAQAAATKSALETIGRSVSSVSATALIAADSLAQVKVDASQAAETDANLGIINNRLDDTRNKAITTAGALALLGFGGGRGIPLPFIGPGLRGGTAFGGMAAFGSIAGLAGFGAERALTSTLGIGGSLLGGIAGGGLLGLGALGTTAVGMGTDMAGIGQAAGDIKGTTQALDQLQKQIQIYGKNSREAALAQAQLNQQLASFSPVARNAVLAAAQTATAFHTMFNAATGAAEATGAEIINQAMQVGEKFLPTIGKFAAQNMQIIQADLQPFFAWLQNPTSGVGGLGVFTDLEKIFQKNLPTSIHALEQGFELLTKTMDVAAQHVGGFMEAADDLFTRMNSTAGFAKWSDEVNKLIGLFTTWLHLFGSVGGLIFDLFKPAVGFGQAFAAGLTEIINKTREWLSASGTQDVLHNLFSAHLQQLQAFFSVIQALLPMVEATISAFLQIEAAVASLVSGPLKLLADLIKTITDIPFADKAIGWATALLLARNAILAVWTATTAAKTAFLAVGPAALLGFGSAEAETTPLIASLDAATASVDALNATLAGTGAAAAAGAGVADAAVASIGAEAGAATGVVDGLRASLLSLGGPLAVLGGVALAYKAFVGGNGKNFVGATSTGNVYRDPNTGKYVIQGPRGGIVYSNTPPPGVHVAIGGAAGAHGGGGGFGITSLPGGGNTGGDVSGHPGSNPFAAQLASQLAAFQRLYGHPHSLPSGIPGVGGGGGGGGGGVPALTGPNTVLATAQQAFLAATGAGTTPRQQEAGALAYLAALEKIKATVEKLHETNKQDLTVQRDLVTIARDINTAKAEEAKADKEIAQIQLGNRERGILGIGTGGANTTSSILSLRAQAKTATTEIVNAAAEGLDVTPLQTELKKIQQVLKNNFVPPDVRQAIRSQFQSIKQTIQTELADALSAAKDAVSAMQQQVSSAFQIIQNAADAAFQNNMQQHLNDMQVLVNSPLGKFLFGGSITQTPAGAQLAALQEAHTQQQLQAQLAAAQQAVANAVGAGTLIDVATGQITSTGGDSTAMIAAQQQLADAQYAIQENALQQQDAIEQTAATTQLAAAKQTYQDQQTVIQSAMDQQTAAIETGMENGTISATTGWDEIKAIWSKNGIDLNALSFAIGGQIYNGLNAGLAPVFTLLKTLMQDLVTAMNLANGAGVVGVGPDGSLIPLPNAAGSGAANYNLLNPYTPAAAPAVHVAVNVGTVIGTDLVQATDQIHEQLLIKLRQNGTNIGL